MNTLDRIIRIIYRELNLSDFLNLSSDGYGLDQNIYNIKINDKIRSSFDIGDKNFKDKIKYKYLETYPENYNSNEVDTMLDWIEEELSNLGYDNYCSLFFYVVKDLFICQNNRIKVDFDHFLEWHGFMNKVDFNIFYAAYLAHEGIDNHDHSTYIDHDNNVIYNRLENGIAENHMHFKGSGYTTDMNWYEFVNSRPYEKIDEKLIDSMETDKLKTSIEENMYKLSINKLKIVRLYLYSLAFDKNGLYREFEGNLLLKFLQAESRNEIELIYNVYKYGKKEIDNKGHKRQGLESIYDLYERHLKKIGKRQGKEKKYIVFEREFLKRLFVMYENKELTDFQLYLFNAYLLGINKVKFEFIQDSVGMGFEKFKYKENIKEILIGRKGYTNEDIYRTVFDNYYSERYVKYIELRVAPKKNIKSYMDMIDIIDRVNDEIYRKHIEKGHKVEKIEYGIIIHYIKSKEEFNTSDGLLRKEKSLDGLELNKRIIDSFFSLNDLSFKSLKEPDINNVLELRDKYILGEKTSIGMKEVRRYNKVFSLEDIKILEEKYRGSNYYKSKIVGIDTANYELNFRPENFGPIYRSHRYNISKDYNLNYTYHVGEDFNTLCNGLRAIDEVIEFLGYEKGDRLGHAVALGLDVDEYFSKKRSKLSSNIEEYIDDIIWMYKMISNSDFNDNSILRFLEDEFSKYKNLYLKNTSFQDIDINEYIDSYNLRGDDPRVYINLFENNIDMDYYKHIRMYGYKLNYKNPNHKHSFFNKTARDLYFSYQYSSSIKLSSREVLVFNIDEKYKEAVSLCQSILRKKVYDNGIEIETNPSSNKKISSVSRFIDLPLFKFNKYGLGEEYNKDNLPISTNTDDSAIFLTNLVSEYSFIAAALIREGFEKESVYGYIENLAKYSIEHNFINR